MPLSATAFSGRLDSVQRVGEIREFVGGTPLIRLRRSGDGKVWIKHEGLQPGGSFFDRVARHQLQSLPQDCAGVVLDGSTSFTVSSLTLAAAGQTPSVVLLGPDAPPRLLGLIRKLAGTVRRYKDADERSNLLGELESEGYIFLDRHDPDAHLRAVTELAIEVNESSDRPIANWVLVDYGVDVTEVERAIRRTLGFPVKVRFVADDHEVERTLAGEALSRRTQVGHREGMLIGPMGAEVVDLAVDLAVANNERVCAVIPDGGHRYLGWW